MKRLCELVHVSRSSFYAWLAAAPARARRAARDAVLVARIRTIHDAENTIGAPRATTELNDGAAAGDRVNHKRVARVMRAAGIAGYRSRRRVHTTIVEQSRQTVPDLLRRDFTAPAPNQVYVGDITYLPLAGGTNLYLATVIDCCSRKLAGWALADHMRTDLVSDALHAAERARGRYAGRSSSDHQRSGLHLECLRRTLRPARSDPFHGRGRIVGGQRPGRVVQRHRQTRGPPGQHLLARRGHLPTAGLQVADPLQHPTTTLLLPAPVPEHLRTDTPGYRHSHSRAASDTVSKIRDQGPSSARRGGRSRESRTRSVAGGVATDGSRADIRRVSNRV